jgi:gamma-glutamyl-gamma-aminobutyrate hydrolase PuuD
MDPASKKSSRKTLPTTATLVFPEERGDSVPRVGTKIATVAETIPLRIAMQAPTAHKEDVDREVERLLESRQHGTASPGSLAQRLVSEILEKPESFPSSSLIVEKARVIAGHVDSVVLPGGEDISPHLYGGTQESESEWAGDYRRSLLELGLIHQCFNKGIPLMAICRGFQMTSVYFGARLHQHVGRQVGVRILGKEEPCKPALGLFGNALDGIRTAVFHHQAVPAGAEMTHLQPALTRTIDGPPDARWEAVLAAESSGQMAPLIGVQFHPEFFESGPARAGAASVSEVKLDWLARRYIDPESNLPGMTNPAHMIASGILNHMSPGNDALWKILAGAAQIHRHKAQIRPEVLAGGRAALKPVEGKGDRKSGLGS